jgi:hypothetical protein
VAPTSSRPSPTISAALLLVSVCGILLILDLGTLSRFLSMLMSFKFWDPMSIGGMLGVFGMLAFGSSALSLLGGEGMARVRRRLGLIGIISGFRDPGPRARALCLSQPAWHDRAHADVFPASGGPAG